MLTDFNLDAISILYTVVSLNVIWRLGTNWSAFWDNKVTAADRQLADATAVFLLIPIGVFFHELGHAIATWQVGGTVLEFQWRIFWGYVVSGGEFTIGQRWWMAFSGNLVSIVLGAIALPFIPRVKRQIAKYLLLSFGRVQLIYSLVLYPLISFMGQRGDWLRIYDFSARPYAQITFAIHLVLLVFLWRLNKRFEQSRHPAIMAPGSSERSPVDRSTAQYYRQMIRSALEGTTSTPLPPSNATAELEEYFQNLYIQQQQRVTELRARNAQQSAIETQKLGVFILASGLFTFGRLELADVILDNTPHPKGDVVYLTSVLKALLPIPQELDPLQNPDTVKAWIKAHQHQLQWNPKLEKFVMTPTDSESESELASEPQSASTARQSNAPESGTAHRAEHNADPTHPPEQTS